MFYKNDNITTKTAYWALEVAPNYCPPEAGKKVTMIVAATDASAIAESPGDIIIAFAASQIIATFEVQRPLSKQGNYATFIPSPDEKEPMEHVAAVKAYVVGLDCSRLSYPDRAEMKEGIMEALHRCAKSESKVYGVARPLDDLQGQNFMQGVQYY